MSTTSELQPGTILHGIYRIEKILGQGGFGITYLAYETTLKRHVAIKEFYPNELCNRDHTTSYVIIGNERKKDLVEHLKGRFLREAEHIAKCDNPGIIRIHSIFAENQTAYYVMDFVEGASLKDKVEAQGPLPAHEALRYTRLLGYALEYIHSRKINHFDIKPANILIKKSDDTPVLIDFGLSKGYDSNGDQTSTAVMGRSHGYAPLEQYDDKEITVFSPTSDIYSLAATLYFMLEGEKPSKATDLVNQPLTFTEKVPEELRAPILKAMATARKDRYQTVREFIDALDGTDYTGESDIDDNTEIQDPTILEKQIVTTPTLPEPSNNPEPKPDPDNGDKNKKLIITGACVGAAAIIAAIFMWMGIGTGKSHIENVNGISVDTPFGSAVYTGEATTDSLGRLIPHGKGKAEISEGKYVGSVYEGGFSNGKMEGEAEYILNNGEAFRGVFKANDYSDGTYTLRDGTYFTGEFKNGTPDQAKGKWYDRTGNVTSSPDPIISRLISNMVHVDGGTFTMGTDDPVANPEEKPAHAESVDPFSIGRYEVSQKEWKRVMGTNPSANKGDDLPVEKVSQEDCLKFIKKLNEMTGLNFRLPTEAEWEFAAKGGNRSKGYRFSGGDNLADIAWFSGNSGIAGTSDTVTHKVGTLTPNELGLYDMTGNVWEWTSDHWSPSYGALPTNQIVRRGGAFKSKEAACRPTYRDNCKTTDTIKNSGFRLAL